MAGLLNVTVTSAPAVAQYAQHGRATSPAGKQPPPGRSRRQREDARMDLPFSRNADADFMRAIVLHHEGTIAMFAGSPQR